MYRTEVKHEVSEIAHFSAGSVFTKLFRHNWYQRPVVSTELSYWDQTPRPPVSTSLMYSRKSLPRKIRP